MIFFLPFQNHWLVNSETGGFTPMKVAGLTLFVASLLRALSRGFPSVFRSLTAKALLFFAFWTTLSWVFAGHAAKGLESWTTYGVSNVASVLIFLFIVLVFVDSKARLERMIHLCVAAMGLGGMYIIRGYLGGDDRPGWPFQDANYYALYAMAALPIGLAALQTEKRKLYRLAYAGCLGLTLVGVFLSASRAGFIILLLFAFIKTIRGKQINQRIWLVGALGLASLFVAPKAIDRLLNPSDFDKQSNEGHRLLAKAAWQAMLDHPVLGVGPSAAHFKGYLEQTGKMIYGVAHNTFLEIGADSGFPALASYLLILISAWLAMRRRAKEFGKLNEPFLEALAGGLQFSLANAALMGLTITAAYVRFWWFVIILAVLLNDKRFSTVPQSLSAQAVPFGGQSYSMASAPGRAIREIHPGLPQ